MELRKDKSNHMTAVIFALAGPTMLEQLMQTAVQYVDTAMVGSLGTQATAAVGSTGTVNWLISSTISAVGVGFLSYISRALGENDRSKARAASGQAVFMVMLSRVRVLVRLFHSNPLPLAFFETLARLTVWVMGALTVSAKIFNAGMTRVNTAINARSGCATCSTPATATICSVPRKSAPASSRITT